MKKILMYSGLFLMLVVLCAFGLSYATPHFRSVVSHVTGVFTIIGLSIPLGASFFKCPIKKELQKVIGCIIVGSILIGTMYIMWITNDYGILKHVVDIAWSILNVGTIFFEIALGVLLLKWMR